MKATIRFIRRRDAFAPLLVLLHDDGEDEKQAQRIGGSIWPGAPVASIRGENRHNTGWRHLSEQSEQRGVLDFETETVVRLEGSIFDCARRQRQLVEIIGVGMGGGADALTALICPNPSILAGAILCRPRRSWSSGSWESIRHGNGIDILVVSEDTEEDQSVIAKRMLTLAGHHVDLASCPRDREMVLCRNWLHRQLLGDK